MNRRSFFSSLALLGAAAACPGIFLPKFEPVRWKVARPVRSIPNPAWVKAPFEVYFVDMPPMFDETILSNDKIIFGQDKEVVGYLHERIRMETIYNHGGRLSYPPRYDFDPGKGFLVQVPPFIRV